MIVNPSAPFTLYQWHPICPSIRPQNVVVTFMAASKFCGPTLSYDDRVLIAQNICNQAKGQPNAVMTAEFKEGLAGWDEKPAKRMGIQMFWVSTDGTNACMAQCKTNSDQTPALKKKCGLQKCEVCNPPED